MALQVNIEETEKEQAYIFGSKTPDETVFFLQIVTEKRLNKMKSFFLGQENIDWYYVPVTIPYKLFNQPEPEVKPKEKNIEEKPDDYIPVKTEILF